MPGISQIDEYFACRLILLLRGHFRCAIRTLGPISNQLYAGQLLARGG